MAQITQSTSDLIAKHRDFFRRGETRTLEYRKRVLQSIIDVVTAREPQILEALKQDLGRPEFEAYVSEVAFVRGEARHAIKHLKKWARPERVSSPLTIWPASSWVVPEAKGCVLVIGPWNYPFQLLLAPLIGAIAAGNTVVLKPSEHAPHVAREIRAVVEASCPPELVSIVEGEAEVARELLSHRWDHVFFTVGTETGRKVMEACAKTLSPVTLELGGKSPCVIDRDVDLEVAARRVVWGKFMNCGQTCIAPDYLVVHREIKDVFVTKLKETLSAFYGADPRVSPDYGRIISQRHCERLMSYLSNGRVVHGGEARPSERYFAPTLLDEVVPGSPVLREEIFGPVLPILTHDGIDSAKRIIEDNPRPLALYVFTRDKSFENEMLSSVAFGGGCVNDTVLHVSNASLPFGGIGESGIGAYHGRFGFDIFSHKKSLVRKPFFLDLKLRYPPYGNAWKKLKALLG